MIIEQNSVSKVALFVGKLSGGFVFSHYLEENIRFFCLTFGIRLFGFFRVRLNPTKQPLFMSFLKANRPKNYE